MKKITLYRVTRSDGGIDITPNKLNSEYTETYRLIADEGKVLTDRSTCYGCIDTDNPDDFIEIAENETSNDTDEATTADLYEALGKLGVS